MLTGDRPESAAIVAKELHLDGYRAGLLPEGKAAELESLGPRQSVLFVGDGINDAPVLAMSGVGVAMGGLGSEAAIEVADAVILDDSPSRLPEMFSIAAKTRLAMDYGLAGVGAWELSQDKSAKLLGSAYRTLMGL